MTPKQSIRGSALWTWTRGRRTRNCISRSHWSRWETSGRGSSHYRAYLEDVAKEPDKHRGENGAVISALIKVADGDATSGQLAAASQGYSAAIQFAQKSKDATLQSLALTHSADVLEHLGKPAEAANAYQQALKLDEQSGDAKAAAIDWLNYGQFLQRQKQPDTFVFACFLKAEDLLRDSPGSDLSAVIKQREATEATWESKPPQCAPNCPSS